METTLYYWPEIQGRGEFVRLALEQAAVPYTDLGREDESAIEAFLDDAGIPTPPFAPPFLVAGPLVIAQTANIFWTIARPSSCTTSSACSTATPPARHGPCAMR